MSNKLRLPNKTFILLITPKIAIGPIPAKLIRPNKTS